MFRKITLSVAFIITLCATLCAQDNAIGLRLGDPLGITYKRFLTENKAIDFLIGTVPKGWLGIYYKNSFYQVDDYDEYEYHDHDVNSTFYIQARMLFHRPIPSQDLGGELTWYWGVGATLKVADIDYVYYDIVPPRDYYTDNRTDVDFGPEGIGGLEFNFKGAPIAAFSEINFMLELFDRPIALRALLGIGARYRF